VRGALLALLLLAVAPAGAAADGVYAGWVGAAGNGDAVVVRTDAAGTRATSAAVAFSADCDNGQYFAFHRRLALTSRRFGVAVNAGGVLDVSYRARTREGELRFAETGRLRGRFHPAVGRGSLRMTVRVLDDAGATVTTCRTGALRWRARRGAGRFYGGMTDQGEPVALTVGPRGHRVEHMAIGWHASCDTGAGIDIPSVLTDLPLIDRLFGHAQVYTDGAGGTLAIDLSGRVGPTFASGRLSIAVMTSEGETCADRMLRWRATSG
jgi:hypothetical protein